MKLLGDSESNVSRSSLPNPVLDISGFRRRRRTQGLRLLRPSVAGSPGAAGLISDGKTVVKDLTNLEDRLDETGCTMQEEKSTCSTRRCSPASGPCLALGGNRIPLADFESCKALFDANRKKALCRDQPRETADWTQAETVERDAGIWRLHWFRSHTWKAFVMIDRD